jgi:hypothetical protein
MLNDLRYALRVLLAAKGWTAVIVASLRLASVRTAIFKDVNGLLLRKLL